MRQKLSRAYRPQSFLQVLSIESITFRFLIDLRSLYGIDSTDKCQGHTVEDTLKHRVMADEFQLRLPGLLLAGKEPKNIKYKRRLFFFTDPEPLNYFYQTMSIGYSIYRAESDPSRSLLYDFDR